MDMMDMKRLLKRTWKQIRGYIPLAVFTFIMIMFSAPVLAAYNYVIPIQIANNSATSYTGLPLLVTLDNDQLVTTGYIAATGLDTDVQESSPIPFSVVDDKLGIFLDNLAASQTISLSDYLGYTPNATSYPIIPGVGGNITTADDATIELANNSTVEIEGYIDTDAGSEKYIVYKEDSFAIKVSAAEEITAGLITASDWNPVPDEFDAAATSYIDNCEIDTDKFVIVYANGAVGNARVGSVAGQVITWGLESSFDADVIVGFPQLSVTKLDTDKFVVVYVDDTDDDGWSRVGVVAGETIAWGAAVEFANTDSSNMSCAAIDTDKFAITYNNITGGNLGTVVICTVAGDVITPGLPVVFEGLLDFSTSTCKLDTDKFVSVYRDGVDGDKLKACAFTVVGTVPTPGVIKEIDADTCIYPDSAQLDTDKFVITWRDASNAKGYTEICTVSGTTITEGTEYEYAPSNNNYSGVCKVDSSHYLITYYDTVDGDKGKSRFNSFSGTDVTLGDVKTFEVDAVSYNAVCLYNTDSVVVTYYNSDDTKAYACLGAPGDIIWGKEVSATGITSDEMKITVILDTVDLEIYIDDVLEDTIALAGSSATDNGNTWYWMLGSDTMPYMNFATIDVAGVNQLWYQPVTIIQGTAAVDRSGTGNHGVIAWGTNPAGIEITASSAISATDYFAAAGEGGIPSPLPIPSEFNMTATNTTGIADFWLYGLVNRAALALGFSAQTMYVIIGLVAATGVGFGALIGTGNMLGFSIGFGATAGLFAATGIMPWWVVTITISIVAMGIYTWRRG